MSFVSLSDKVQAAPIKRDLIQWCPTMDLLAMISDSDEVFLNRLSGQRVWSVNPALTGQEAEVPVSLTWRPDGKVLALGLADGSLHCLDLNDGRTIDCLRKQGTIQNDSTALLKWLQRDSNKKRTSTKHLILDVRSQLPVLAPIPSSST